jgi:CRP/FNR family cyclic AMP-dependent transcriptional regulator
MGTATSIEALPESLLERLARQAVTRSYPKNAVIVTEGDESDSLYILLSGRAKVYVSGEGGRELYLNQLHPGEYFGEVRLDGGPRSASVTALEDCRCAILRGDDLARALAEHPEFALHVIRKLAHRVRALTESARSLALMDVYGRVAALLLELAEQRDGHLEIRERPTQREIASRVGASREMVSRILKDLETGGYITVERELIVIHRHPPKRW